MNKQTNSQKKNEHTFKKLPDFLFTDSRYSHISNDSKLLYSLLLSRHHLSEKNQDSFTDKRGIYLIFTRENLALTLHCSTKKVTRLMRELCITGLIREKQMGLNKPNRIYIQPVGKENNLPSEKNEDSPIYHGHDTMSCQEETKNEVQNTTINPLNQRDNNYIDSSISIFDICSLSFHSNTFSSLSKLEQNNSSPHYKKMYQMKKNTKKDEQLYISARQEVKEQIKFEECYALIDEDMLKQVKAMISIMVDVKTSKKTTMRINSQDMGIDLIRRQFYKINPICIDYILENMSDLKTNIRDIRAYLRTALYNAPDIAECYFHSATGL